MIEVYDSIPYSNIQIFKDSVIQSFTHSVIQSFSHSKIQRFKDSIIHSLIHSIIQRFKDSKIQRFGSTVILVEKKSNKGVPIGMPMAKRPVDTSHNAATGINPCATDYASRLPGHFRNPDVYVWDNTPNRYIKGIYALSL